MKIYVVSASGEGQTELSAFDMALIRSGTANFNLIRLSSVIPPSSDIIEGDSLLPGYVEGEWGDRLYAVYAEARTSTPGETVAAGVGWVQEPGTLKGLFVEHEGHSEEEVESLIRASLTDLMRNRGMNELPIQSKVISVRCNDQPVCALVVAAYQSSKWL